MQTDVTRIAAPLLAWHVPDARTLPWRDTTDPYAILVSEIMAQQTQAARAAVAWTAFMQRFPTVHALAGAPVADVIAQWEGLGYNRRAVNLHRCAQAVVADHGGVIPDDRRALEALPGLGPYTARAVLAFAFGRDVVPVDTNVARILSRVGEVVLSRPQAQALADDLAAHGRGPAISAGLMDLGAATCTARRPRCDDCPLRSACAWRGGPGEDPAARGDHRPRPQGSFDGSSRQARGRIVRALRQGPLDEADALALAGPRGQQVIDALLADGLIAADGGRLALPGATVRSGTDDAPTSAPPTDGTFRE